MQSAKSLGFTALEDSNCEIFSLSFGHTKWAHVGPFWKSTGMQRSADQHLKQAHKFLMPTGTNWGAYSVKSGTLPGLIRDFVRVSTDTLFCDYAIVQSPDSEDVFFDAMCSELMIFDPPFKWNAPISIDILCSRSRQFGARLVPVSTFIGPAVVTKTVIQHQLQLQSCPLPECLCGTH